MSTQSNYRRANCLSIVAFSTALIVGCNPRTTAPVAPPLVDSQIAQGQFDESYDLHLTLESDKLLRDDFYHRVTPEDLEKLAYDREKPFRVRISLQSRSAEHVAALTKLRRHISQRGYSERILIIGP